MLRWKFFLGLSLYIIGTYSGFIQDKLFDGVVLHVDRFTGECRGQNLPCKGFFHGVTSKSTSLLIRNYTLLVNQGGFNKVVFSITIERCRSKENLDTCELYFKQPKLDLCKVIDPNNLITGKTLKAFPLEPPLRCPADKGIYHAYNFSYDLAPYLFFRLDDWYWKVKTEFFTPKENKLIYCSHLEGHVTNNKSKKN